MNASQYQETFRILKCLSYNQFREIFSNMDEDWCKDKFEVRARDMVLFVGGLDNSNAKRLFSYLGDRLDENADLENIRINSK